ncbi:unnamed protein product [Porites evermanni]|uniref:CHAT domain-containing protein n=1 Tax=Porites evermanni TaxID=104178 RepID=A0ABN8MJP1_9CNID|nr:unnamed protein product [Porites evermanni]
MAERILQDIAEQKKRLKIAQINKNTEEKADAYYNLGKAYFSLEDFHRAIEYLKQYLSIAEELGNRAGAACAYRSLGFAYLLEGDSQRAIEYQNQDLRIAKEAGDRAAEGCAYGNLGFAYHSLKEFQRAIEYHNRHLRIAKEVGDRACQGKAYANLGLAYGSLEEFQRAIEYTNKYLIIAKEVGDRVSQGKAYANLGHAYHSLKEFKRAIEYHNQHLSIAEEVGDRVSQGKAYANLGHAYHSLKEFKRAIEYHNQHLSIAEEVGDRAGEGQAYADLGVAYQSLSEFQRAIENTNKCLNIAKEAGDRAAQETCYANLGSIYYHLGKDQQAMEYTNKYLNIAKEVGDRASEGNAYSQLGVIYNSLDNYPEAMKCHKKQLDIATEVGDREGKGRAYLSIGLVHESLGDVQQAMENYKQCLRNAEEIGDSFGQGRAYCRLGGCYRKLHDLEEAIGCYKQHLSIAEERGDRMSEACAQTGLGHSFLQSNSLNEALVHFRCCVKIYNTIRANSILEDQLKISFCTSHQCAYTHLWQVLVMLQRIGEALYAADRGRAQALFDALKVTYGLTPLSPRLIESEEEEVRNILRNTTVLTVFLALDKNILSMWVLRKEGNPFFWQLMLQKIGKEHKDSFALLLDFVLKTIGAGVRIRCENRSMDKLSTTTSTTRDEHQASEASQETTDCLQQLYDAVLGPIENLLDGDELIVVPDGALSKAPWAAMSETLRIRTVPSLTSLKLITDSPSGRHSKSGALLVGDPCLEKVKTKDGKPYDPLKYARMEVEMIGKILESKPLTGEDATKEAVLQRIGSVALIHIAAHGRKETGEIVLAPDRRLESDTPKEEDCIMKMSDIQAVKLRARLVVLSCCHSGQGEVSSEGVVGMARAFLFAGARSVLATLWAIDDEATMMFMESFYQQLGSGESASVALQRAMKRLRDSHDYSAPKYWAPFVLMGDDVKIELEKESLRKSDALKV